MMDGFWKWFWLSIVCGCAAMGGVPSSDVPADRPAAIVTPAPEATAVVVATAIVPPTSRCVYRADFSYEVPSGQWLEVGEVVEGPAWAIPVENNMAIFSKKVAVPEGTTFTASVLSVQILYAANTRCDLVAEDYWTPDLP